MNYSEITKICQLNNANIIIAQINSIIDNNPDYSSVQKCNTDSLITYAGEGACRACFTYENEIAFKIVKNPRGRLQNQNEIQILIQKYKCFPILLAFETDNTVLFESICNKVTDNDVLIATSNIYTQVEQLTFPLCDLVKYQFNCDLISTISYLVSKTNKSEEEIKALDFLNFINKTNSLQAAAFNDLIDCWINNENKPIEVFSTKNCGVDKDKVLVIVDVGV